MAGAGMKNLPSGLTGLLSRKLRQIGTGTGLALLLLLLSLSTVAYGLTLVVRGLSLSFAFGLVALGLLIGWLLARSKWAAWQSAGLAFLLGLAVLFLHVGQLAAVVFALLLRTNSLVGVLFRGPLGTYNRFEFVGQAWSAGEQLLEGVSVLLGRMAAYFYFLLSGRGTFDPLASLILWGFTLWCVAAWASWLVRRHSKPVAAILPGGVVLAACLSYSRSEPTILLALLASTLLLILLVEHQSLRRGWEVENIDYSEELGLDIAMVAVPMAAMILAAAAFSPSIAPRRIVMLVQDALRNPNSQIANLGDSLGLQQAPPRDYAYDQLRDPGMPRRHLLGSGPELSQEVVMEVRTLQIEVPPEVGPAAPGQIAHLNYWRSLTYDIYTSSGWTADRPETLSYRAGQPAQPPGSSGDEYLPVVLPHHIILTQEIKNLGDPQGMLYAAGTVISVDTDYQLAWRPLPSQAGPDIFGGMVEKPHYQVRSQVATAVGDQLYVSSSSYPDEIRSRYLALPDTLPQRVHSLALELTATLPTTYERALAIESYLRSIPYSLDVPNPPRNRDAVDVYLFDLKRGYCDYSASAMVVLARAAGIPARLVTGYAGGHYEPARGVMVVTGADAHSWPELYFPGTGWVEFEPTGGRPGLEYLPEGQPMAQSPLEIEPSSTPESLTAGRIGWSLLGVFLVAVALPFAGWQIDRIRLARMSPDRTVILLYSRFLMNGIQLASGSKLSETPYEFAAKLSAWMERLSASNRWVKRLAVKAPEINRLTMLYARTVYSPHPTSRVEQDQAVKDWDRIRWRFWLLRLYPWSDSGSKAHE
jgi:transglutaminase-like putative cysteine protease